MTAKMASSTTENLAYDHPDRTGTKLVTDGRGDQLQSTFPFGTTINAEGGQYINQIFTSYDRSSTTGLDYADNRTYSKGQSRFTQADPLEMGAASPGNPQSNNLYAYTQNIPTDFVDPSGLNMIAFIYPTNCRIQGDFWVCDSAIHWMYIPDGGRGGDWGGGGGGGTPPQTQPQKPKKPKCKQSKTQQERDAAQASVEAIAPPGSVGNFRNATDSHGNPTEGTLFDIFNVPAIRAAMKGHFNMDTIFNWDHTGQVGGNIFNTSDNRSIVSGQGNLGPDLNSNGIVRSLQLVIGPFDPNRGLAIGYADHDCDNPAEDLVSMAKHAGPIIGRAIGNIFRWIF